MSVNSSHPIGQYCRWALLPAESLNEQVSGTTPTGATGSIVTLPQGDAYVPSTTATTWTSSAAIDPYVNDVTIVYYGRLDASFSGAMLAEFTGGGYGWEFRTSFWDGSFPRLELIRAFWGNGSAVNFGGAGDDVVHHVVLRISKAAGTLDWFLDGSAHTTGVSWNTDGAIPGGSVKMRNVSSSTNACITLQIYDRALSDADIASLASAPTQIFAAPPQDLSIASLSQSNSASTAEIGIGGILYGSALSQANSISSGQVTRDQDLTVSNPSQGNAASNGSINPYSRLRSILRELPVNTWVKVNTSKYVDCQMPLADRPVGYPNAWDHVKIVIPWSSVAFDHTRGHLLLWGGGHANYIGNQLYQWHADTGEWSLACLPSQVTSDSNLYVVDGRAPQSSHTYQNNVWLKENDMFCTFGGAATPSGGPPLEDNGGTDRRVGPWLYDLTKTDPEKVGGSDGSGVDTSRLGLNAWQHRRDNVPTGVAGTDTYPIDYANHVSQTAVSVSKDGKDYVIFTMDGNSGFPSWYRYEFGNVRLGEDDQCIYLGRSTQTNTIIKEGWMVYDRKRELVYRNGYNKDTNYTLAELVVKEPWTPGVAETAIRLVKTSDGTTFTMNPVTDECPYGAVYDERNDCIYLWGGTSPDTGVVYKVNIPAYDEVTGWSSTTWNVDTITPAGSRPNGLYQTPILGKIKYVPELSSFIILDRAGAAGDPDPGVWLFKTAQIQGDLLAANLDQGNPTATGTITVEHTLSTGVLAQNSSVSAALISQEGALFASGVGQSNSVSEASLSQIQNVSVSGLTQSNSVPDIGISQVVTINLGSGNLSQGNLVDAKAITEVLNISASNANQVNTTSNAAISQEHTLVAIGIAQINILPNGEITKNGTLVVVSVEQSNAIQAIAVVQEQVLAGLNISQDNGLPSGIATQARILVCSGITQSNTASTGAISSSTNDLVAVSITQINACPSRGIALNQIIIATNIAQSNVLGTGAITAFDGPPLTIDPKYIAYSHRKNYTAKYGD